MPVERYRDVSEMPPPPRPRGSQLLRCIAAVWERAHLRGLPEVPRGVARYRSLAEAQAARRRLDRQRARRLRGLEEG